MANFSLGEVNFFLGKKRFFCWQKYFCYNFDGVKRVGIKLGKSRFRCLSLFKIGIHISLEQSVWADLSWNPFQKCIASICFGPKHSGNFFGGHFSIFAGFWNKFRFKIGWFTLTFRVTLLKRFNLKTFHSKIIIFKTCVNSLGKNLKLLFLVLLINVNFKKLIILTKMFTVCEKGHFLPFLAHCTHFCQYIFFF